MLVNQSAKSVISGGHVASKIGAQSPLVHGRVCGEALRRRLRAGTTAAFAEQPHADKAYDSGGCATTYIGAGSPLASPGKGVDSSERLGWYRRVVERTIAWLLPIRRLVIR